MRIPFHKMHGAGNDFVVVDERAGSVALSRSRIAALADRHAGIGCDQFITIEPAQNAHARLRFFNPDGREAGACGNGTRCAADLLMRDTGHSVLRLLTLGGLLEAARLPDGRIRVDMGEPRLDWRDIPLSHQADTLHLDMPGDPAAVSMGNPHVTFFDEALDQAPVRGPSVERDPMFPQGVNAGFAQVLDSARIRLRVWERGAGLTLACGSGACAALVNASRRGLTGRAATVIVDGGALDITWREDGHVEMTGPVASAFVGQFDPDAFPA
jgi:diaminopimelate epimerase